jgi:CheY-like chemotaxis protein
VEADSKGKGRGATVTVRLPLAAVRALVPAAGARAVQPTAAPRRILIVENNEDAAETLRTLLDLSGHAVEVAGDGPSALAAAAAFRPDVVLCDIGLPGDMDGYAVAAALRKANGGTLHLVALTGYGRPGDVERARQVGFERHLTKPADPETIRRVLDGLPAPR